MRKLIASLFISLDGVVEAPDQWHFPYFNDEMGQAVGEAIAASDSMLLGRRTYEEWAAFWPQQDPAADPFVSVMNETPKFVASTTLEKVEWQNTTPLESIWIDPYPDEHLGLEDGNAAPEARYEQRETIELAFIVALQHLPARQRAVLILREVLGFSAREVAQALDTTAAPVNSALQRARKTVDGAAPAVAAGNAALVGRHGLRGLVQRCVEAWKSRNVDAMVSLLVEDASFAMPPFPCWFSGREDVVAFISQFKPRLRHVIVSAVELEGGSREGDHGVCGLGGVVSAVRAACRAAALMRSYASSRKVASGGAPDGSDRMSRVHSGYFGGGYCDPVVCEGGSRCRPRARSLPLSPSRSA